MRSENSSHHPVVKYLGKFPWSNEIGQYWVKLHLVGVLLSRQNFLALINVISLLTSMNIESLFHNTPVNIVNNTGIQQDMSLETLL